VRNIAIVAHVDHGKTTLVDSMLRQSKVHPSSTQTHTLRTKKLAVPIYYCHTFVPFNSLFFVLFRLLSLAELNLCSGVWSWLVANFSFVSLGSKLLLFSSCSVC
jgi:hypothetical protein